MENTSVEMGITHHHASILSKYTVAFSGTTCTWDISACTTGNDTQVCRPPSVDRAAAKSNSDTMKTSNEMIIAVNKGRRKVTVMRRDERYARSESC